MGGLGQCIKRGGAGGAGCDVLRGAVKGIGTTTGAQGEGIKAYADAVPTGRHWNPPAAFSPEDAEALKRFGGRVGLAGSALEAAVAGYDIKHGAPVGETIAKLGGSVGGSWFTGWFAGSLAGSTLGPEAALPAGFVGAIVGGETVERLVGKVFGE